MANVKLKDKKQNLTWTQQILSLILLLSIGLVIVYFVPKISNSSLSTFKNNSYLTPQEMISLVLLSAITVIFLSYYRTKSFFSTKWLIAATVFNILILLVKFTLSSNEINKGNNNISTIGFTALVVSSLYILGLFVLYLIFEGKLISRAMHKKLIVESDGKILLTLYMFVFITIARVVVYHLPGISNTVAASYLGDIFMPKTYLLSALIFLITYATVESFGQVRRKQDLKSFFSISVGLIIIFHIWWGVFMYRLLV